jgi:hypothetical protein
VNLNGVVGVRGFAPPVVAFTVMAYDPTGVPGLLLLLPPELPPQDVTHTVENPKAMTNASMRAVPNDRFRELKVNAIPNSPGTRRA